MKPLLYTTCLNQFQQPIPYVLYKMPKSLAITLWSFVDFFSSGTVYGMYNLDNKNGNTGELGRYFWRIENSTGKNSREKCLKWASLQKEANFRDWYDLYIRRDRGLACPCTGRQARFDRGRFVWDWNSWPANWCYKSRRSTVFRLKGFTTSRVRQRCCYSTQREDFFSLKVGLPDGSRIEVTPSFYRLNSSEDAYTDQQAYKFCCVDTLALCYLFYFYRPSDDCRNYRPPRRRKFLL